MSTETHHYEHQYSAGLQRHNALTVAMIQYQKRQAAFAAIAAQHQRRETAFAAVAANLQRREAAFAAIMAQHQQRRAAFTAIVADQQRHTITAVNIHATAAAVAEQNLSATRVKYKDDTPPEAAEYLLYLFLPREDRVAMFGDLEEEYRKELLPKFGVRDAQFLYWCKVGRSIVPVISGAIGRILWWLIERFTS